jgi:glyoxylase-like metal-dependent hydrolase (beta-lactamase superfamily II)
MSFRRVSRFGVVNVYLVDEADGLTVIDTAIAGSAKAILRAAEEAGKPITTILLTHAHSDHVGSLDALHERVPDAEIVISTREARLLAGDKQLQPGEPDDKVRGGFPSVEARPTRTVEAGERVGSLEVIPAPGHTPGHIALLDTRDRTLFCGDAYTTLGGVAVPAKPKLAFPLPYFATWHRPTTLATARELRALEPARLAPGHGKVIESPVAAMDDAIATAAG